MILLLLPYLVVIYIQQSITVTSVVAYYGISSLLYRKDYSMAPGRLSLVYTGILYSFYRR